MAFLCPSRSGRNKEKKQKVAFLGRITGSASIDTLVRVGLEKQHGVKPDSKMIATQDFLPCVDKELKLIKGDEVYLLYKENGWAYVITEHGKEGFVPNSFLISYSMLKRRSVLSNYDNDFTMWEIEEESENCEEENNNTADIDFTVISSEEYLKTVSKEKYVVLYDFQIVNENDTNVCQGEVVTLLNSDDTDWSWIMKSNKQEGFIPSSFICILPKDIYLKEIANEPVEEEPPPPLPPRDYKPLKPSSSSINNTINLNRIPQIIHEKSSDSMYSSGGDKSTDHQDNTTKQKVKFSEIPNLPRIPTSLNDSHSIKQSPTKSQDTRPSFNLRSPALLQSINSVLLTELEDNRRSIVRRSPTELQDNRQSPKPRPPMELQNNRQSLNQKSPTDFQDDRQLLKPRSPSELQDNRQFEKPRSPDFVKMVVSSDYCSPAEPFLSVKKGEIVFIDYKNQTNSTWLWVYSPKLNKYGSVPSSLLKQPHDLEHSFSNIALV